MILATTQVVLSLISAVNNWMGYAPSSQSALTLFGGSLGWDVSKWRAIDDRVRGGSSTSFLAKSGQSNARFYGHLDTTTLGGAGFASQKSIYQSIPYDLSQYKGIRLSIVKSDDMKYAFNLQTTVPSSDGQSAVEYKYSFEPKKLNLESASESGSDESIHRVQTLDIKFSDFVAHYRGRKVPNPEPLETSHITTFSIMCQSYFDQQSGDFELVLHEIAAYK